VRREGRHEEKREKERKRKPLGRGDNFEFLYECNLNSNLIFTLLR
jgi:hypothetical protein